MLSKVLFSFLLICYSMAPVVSIAAAQNFEVETFDFKTNNHQIIDITLKSTPATHTFEFIARIKGSNHISQKVNFTLCHAKEPHDVALYIKEQTSSSMRKSSEEDAITGADNLYDFALEQYLYAEIVEISNKRQLLFFSDNNLLMINSDNIDPNTLPECP